MESFWMYVPLALIGLVKQHINDMKRNSRFININWRRLAWHESIKLDISRTDFSLTNSRYTRYTQQNI